MDLRPSIVFSGADGHEKLDFYPENLCSECSFAFIRQLQKKPQKTEPTATLIHAQHFYNKQRDPFGTKFGDVAPAVASAGKLC